MALSNTQYGYIIDPMVPFTDDKGKTIKNGFVRVFVAGSSTPVVTYRNFDGATNQDRIELDNSGRTMTSVIGSKGLTYKVCVYDQHHSQESPILTVDKVPVIGTNITAGTGATVVTGLDGLTTKPDGFVDASVVGTDGYVALDHTLVTDDLDTDAKVTAVEDDRYVPLLNKDVNDPDSKMTLGRLWQWVLGKIKSLSTTITAFRTGDVIPVDGPSGTAKMSKDDLLKIITDNSAPQFDPTRTTDNQYDVGEIVAYGDKTYRFKNAHSGAWNISDVDVVDIAALLGNLVNVTFTNRTYKHIQPNVPDIVKGTTTLTWNTQDNYFHVAEIPVEPNAIYLITNCIMTGNTLVQWAVVDADNVCLDFGLPGSLQPMTINCNDYPAGSKILLSNRYKNPLKVQKMLSYSVDGKLADLKKYVDDADNITITMTATVDGTCSSAHDGGNHSVFIPAPKGASVVVSLPNTMWSCDNYTGTSYVFEIDVKNEDGSVSVNHGRTKSSISDSIGKVRSVVGAGRWVCVFCRADVGAVVSFGVTITCPVKELAKGAYDYANSFYQEILDLKSSRTLLETQDDLLAFDQRNHFGRFLQSGSAFSPYTRPNARYEVSRLLRIAKNPSQGCAIYGQIGVVMNQSYDGWTAFFDIKHNKVLQEGRQLNVKAESTHNNSLFFGTEKHTNTDKFPVLYSSTLDSRLLGWRITEDINGYNLGKVQTITFTGFSSVFASSGFDVFLNESDFVLFGTKYGDSTKRHVAICPAKAYSDGDSTIDYADVTDEFDVTYDKTMQGGFVKNDVLYVAYNYGIVAISLTTKAILDDLDMSGIQYDFEPEQVVEYDGSLIMSTVTKPAFEDDGTSRYTEIVAVRLFG